MFRIDVLKITGKSRCIDGVRQISNNLDREGIAVNTLRIAILIALVSLIRVVALDYLAQVDRYDSQLGSGIYAGGRLVLIETPTGYAVG